MLIVNAGLGVVLCECLADDASLPKGSTFEAVYWSVITSTSVGFGFFHPATDIGKLATVAYAFLTMQACANAMDVAKDYLIDLCTVKAAAPPLSYSSKRR